MLVNHYDRRIGLVGHKSFERRIDHLQLSDRLRVEGGLIKLRMIWQMSKVNWHNV